MARTQVHRYKELRLIQLRAFCETVRHKSFAKAARALGLAQPTVWEQVRALERNCGVSLLARKGRELHPTEDGQSVLELGSSIVGAADSFFEAFRQRRSLEPRTLTIIGTPGVITEELHQPVLEFYRRYPQVRITLLTTYAISRTVDALVSGEADMAILPLGRVELPNPELVSEPLCVRPAVVAIPRGHPLATRPRLTVRALSRDPLIMPESGARWRVQLDEVFRRAGVLDKRKVVLEVSFTEAVRRYVSLGIGIGIMLLPRGKMEYGGVVIRPADHLFPPEHLVILWRRGATPRPQATDFAQLARAILAKSGIQD